jgi:catechol 2,3-dioxygenase-like lactoylglutathione lyase family enzyme
MAKGPDVRLAHVGIYVTDLRKMEAFYTRFFSFTVNDRGKLGDIDIVFLSRDPDEHHQLILATGRPSEASFSVINQISFRVQSLGDLRTMHARLAGEPVTDIRPISHGNAWSVYFKDPEGNRLELYLDTPWYVSQPFREPLDLTQSDETILGETERLCRASPGFRPHAEWRADVARRMGITH